MMLTDGKPLIGQCVVTEFLIYPAIFKTCSQQERSKTEIDGNELCHNDKVQKHLCFVADQIIQWN